MGTSNRETLRNQTETAPHQPINIGVIGFGNVGRGVVHYFQDGRGEPFNIHLKRVAVKDPTKTRDSSFETITGEAMDIFRDPDINIVVELIGGLNPARQYIEEAMSQGQNVVTANKAVMARFAGDLFETARDKGVDLKFEASVGGGIPIINILDRFRGEKIERVMGVLNGTTNFILTRMEEGLDFESALRIAQERGFAEADHILDTGGFDTRDKLALLATLIFNAQVDPETVDCRGITDITPIDIDFARKYEAEDGGPGYAIKLLAVANRKNGSVELRVNPALIRRDHPLAAVRDEVNAIYIEGELAGPQVFSGRGAGTNPTSSAVISDILKVARNIRTGIPDELPSLDSSVAYVEPNDMEQKGYIRVDLEHKSGSLLAVSRIFARHGLSILDSEQRSKYAYEEKGGKFIPDIITLEPASMRVIEAALKDLGKSRRVHGKPFFLSIEE